MVILSVLVIIMAICVVCQYMYIRKLSTSTVEVKRTNDAKSRILAMISHDIRTPLNSIMGSVELAKMYTGSVEQKEYLEKIKTSGDNLLMIVNEMMEYDELESGQSHLVKSSVNVKGLMENIRNSVKLQCDNKKQKLDMGFENLKHANIITDGTKLYRICVNLLTNANKYTNEGGNILLQVWEETEASDTLNLCIRVQDTGIGMTDEFMKNMYNLYERDEEVTEKGFGIGLYIVKSMVHILDGTIQCKSKIGVGTEFLVKIPVVPSESTDENSKIEESELKGMRVLVTDDVRANREIISEYLKIYGVECECAENGSKCVEMINNGNNSGYHAVLMDINMPGLNGIEATKRIRENSDVPVVAISGDSDPESIRRCDEAGMDKCITKPVDFKILVGVLKDIYCKESC